MIKAIETSYKGYRFRSRLEARWAVFFEEVGFKWEYEKEGYDLGAAGYYLPDFWLPDVGIWVEIKGSNPSADELAKAEALCGMTKSPVLIFCDSPWFNIARAFYVVWDDEGTEPEEVVEVSYWYPDHEKDGYDYEQEDGDGCYYQGWVTWGLNENTEKLGIICLVDRDDVRAAHDSRIVQGYYAARSARFEHGEVPA